MLQGLNQLLLQSVMLFRRDFEISQFHAFYHHMSVYFGNLVKKKKADAEVRSRLELQFAANFKLIIFLIQTVYEKRGIPFNKSVINPYRVAIFDKVHYLIFQSTTTQSSQW